MACNGAAQHSTNFADDLLYPPLAALKAILAPFAKSFRNGDPILGKILSFLDQHALSLAQIYFVPVDAMQPPMVVPVRKEEENWGYCENATIRGQARRHGFPSPAFWDRVYPGLKVLRSIPGDPMTTIIKTLTCLLLPLIIACSSTSSEAPPDTAVTEDIVEQLLSAADDALFNGEYLEAETALKRVIQADSGLAGAYFQLGNTYYFTGRYPEAKTQYLKAIETDPEFGDAYMNLGVIYGLEGNTTLEEEQYRKAESLGVRSATLYSNLAIIHKSRNQLGEAEALYRQALALDPSDGAIYSNLAYVYLSRSDFEAAESVLAAAIELSPYYAPTYVAVATLLRMRDEHELAEEAFGTAITVDPENAYSHNAYGEYLNTREEFERAVELFRDARRLVPSNLQYNLNLGIALGRIEQYEEALTYYQAALKLGGNESSIRYRIAYALQILARYEEAAAEYRAVLAFNDSSARNASYNLGIVYENLDQIGQAIVSYGLAIRLGHERAGDQAERLHKYRNDLFRSVAQHVQAESYAQAASIGARCVQTGHPGCAQIVGALYEQGWGVEQDVQAAISFNQMAHALGDGFRFAGVSGGHNAARLLCEQGEQDQAAEWIANSRIALSAVAENEEQFVDGTMSREVALALLADGVEAFGRQLDELEARIAGGGCVVGN